MCVKRINPLHGLPAKPHTLLTRTPLLTDQTKRTEPNDNPDQLHRSPADADDGQPPGPPGVVVLALRKWANFHRSMHFRCFVQGHALVGAVLHEFLTRAF